MKLDRLAPLLALAEVAQSAEQARLHSLNKEIARIRQQLEALNPGAPDLATHAALPPVTLMRWQNWIDQRREALNRDLAMALARQDTQLARMRHAFGRASALQKLMEKEHRSAAQREARRAD